METNFGTFTIIEKINPFKDDRTITYFNNDFLNNVELILPT
jgi:hypothetical protein